MGGRLELQSGGCRCAPLCERTVRVANRSPGRSGGCGELGTPSGPIRHGGKASVHTVSCQCSPVSLGRKGRCRQLPGSPRKSKVSPIRTGVSQSEEEHSIPTGASSKQQRELVAQEPTAPGENVPQTPPGPTLTIKGLGRGLCSCHGCSECRSWTVGAGAPGLSLPAPWLVGVSFLPRGPPMECLSRARNPFQVDSAASHPELGLNC